MCGVFAARLTKGRLSHQRVCRAVQTLSHRGPDDEGIWLGDDRRVALGHRRLSIIGVDNGRQPIANEDETVRVSVNGEFYGFESIRRDLVRRGHRFRTQSDSEILLHLYEEHGTDCLQYLRGEFAFVLWDDRRSRLFAARDRFGVKPLCYSHDAEAILIASEAKALFATGVPRAWDRESFFHASAMQYVLPDRTLFEGVRQVPPGQFLVADGNGTTVRPYWDMQFPPLNAGDFEPDAVPTDHESQGMIDDCRHHVVEAIRLRLRSDVPVCCHLSGGLDSGSVLCVAARLSPQPLDAFTISFAAEGYDELAQARETARSCNANLHVVRVSQDDLLEHLDSAVAASEGLAINGHLSAKFLLHRAVRDGGFKVVLTGEGADEVFAGYAHLRLDQWRFLGRDDLGQDLAESNRKSLGMMLPSGPSLSLDGARQRLGFLPACLEAKATLGWRVRSLMRDEAVAAFRDRDAYGELIDSTGTLDNLKGRHPVNQSTWLWSRTALAGYILKTLGDGTEMPSSVEGRVPMLDHGLFEFLSDIPVALKIRGTSEKYILRQAMRPFIPDALFRREKQPLDAPPLCLFASPTGQEQLNARLRDPSFERQPFFCPRKCAEVLERLSLYNRTERQLWDPALMTVLSTLSLQKFLEGDQ